MTSRWRLPSSYTRPAGGMPRQLAPNQRAWSLLVRDLQEHGTSGNYTVLFTDNI